MNIIERVKRILMTPATEWEIIKAEQASVSGLFSNYAVILAAIPAAAGFIGFSFFGISSGYGSFKFSIGTTLTWAVVSYIMSLIGVFVVGYVIDFFSSKFRFNKRSCIIHESGGLRVHRGMGRRNLQSDSFTRDCICPRRNIFTRSFIQGNRKY